MSYHLRFCVAALLHLSVSSLSYGQSTSYGTATPGLGGLSPSISSGDPSIGNLNFSIDVENALGGAPAVLLFSLGPAQLSLPGGTTLLVDPLPPVFLFSGGMVLGGQSGVPGTGVGSFALPLAPNLPREVIGAAVYVQALIGDISASGAIAASAGLEVKLRAEPMVFVGTSVGGSTDPFYVIEARTNTARTTSNSTYTDNVTDALFAPGGRYLYVSSSLGNAVQRGDLSTITPTWNTFFAAGGSCYGLGLDEARQRLYTLNGASAAGFELTAIDADPTSVNYGQPLGTTLGLASSGFIERWALAPSGNFAIVLSVFSDLVQRVDTDPSSPTYLQVTGSYSLPPATSALRIAVQVRITAGDRWALVLIQNAGATAGEMHRLDVQAGIWFDHDPATLAVDAMGLFSQPQVGFGSAPHGFALSSDSSFAIVTGWSGTGFAGRLNLDNANPGLFSWVPFAPGVTLEGAWACDLSRDDNSVFVGTFPNAPQLHRLDAQTGALLASVPLPNASNVYTVRTN